MNSEEKLKEILRIQDALQGYWELEHDVPVQYLQFIKPLNEGEKGKIILSNSPDLIEARQELEYEIILSENDVVFMNLIVKTSGQTIQQRMNLFSSGMEVRFLNGAKGEYRHYRKIAPPEHPKE